MLQLHLADAVAVAVAVLLLAALAICCQIVANSYKRRSLKLPKCQRQFPGAVQNGRRSENGIA